MRTIHEAPEGMVFMCEGDAEELFALRARIRVLEEGIETVAQYCDQQSDYADENMEGPSGIWFGKCAARLRALL